MLMLMVMIEVHGDVDIVAHANHKEMFRVMITFSVMLMFTVMLMLRVMPTFMHSDANYVQSDADVQTDAVSMLMQTVRAQC